MPRSGVVCGGCWVVDRNKVVDHWPREETLAVIFEETLRGGGPAFNMAVDLARLGAPFPISAVGRIGDDAEAGVILQACRDWRIDPAGLRVCTGKRTSFTDVISVKGTGRRTFFHLEGVNAEITPDDFDFAGCGARILHAGAPGLHAVLDGPWPGERNGWAAVFRKARAAGLKTNIEMVSTAPERLAAIVRPCLPHLDTIIVNDFEIGALAGVATVADGATDVRACRAAARQVMETGAAELIVIHFPRGCVALTRDGAVRLQPSVRVPAEALVGTNGAGDAFAAGVLFGLHQDWPLDDALALGHATSAASLRSVSTSDAVEDYRACLALAATWGWRDPLEV